MAYITLSLDDGLLKASRRYARKHNITLSTLVQSLLSKAVSRTSESRLEEAFRLADKHTITHRGRRWKREDAYSG